MQQGLTLARATFEIERLTAVPDLAHMTHHLSPTAYLSLIVLATSAQVIATVPLEPTAGILMVDPSFLSPFGEGLGRIYTEEVELRVMPFR